MATDATNATYLLLLLLFNTTRAHTLQVPQPLRRTLCYEEHLRFACACSSGKELGSTRVKRVPSPATVNGGETWRCQTDH